MRFERKTCPQLIVLGTQACDPLQLHTTALLGRGQVAEQDLVLPRAFLSDN